MYSQICLSPPTRLTELSQPRSKSHANIAVRCGHPNIIAVGCRLRVGHDLHWSTAMRRTLLLAVALLTTGRTFSQQTHSYASLPCGPGLYRTVEDGCIRYGSRIDTSQARERAKAEFPNQYVMKWVLEPTRPR